MRSAVTGAGDVVQFDQMRPLVVSITSRSLGSGVRMSASVGGGGGPAGPAGAGFGLAARASR